MRQVIVGSRRVQTLDESMFTLHGIDVRECALVCVNYRPCTTDISLHFLCDPCAQVRECALVCVKSSTHFRAAYAPIAEAIITADEPGLSSNAGESFTFTKCAAKPVVGPVHKRRGGKL